MVSISLRLFVFQGRHITISLLYVCARDLFDFANYTAIKVNIYGNEETKRYCSKFQAQFTEKCGYDLNSNYLKLCKLPNPCVNYVLKASVNRIGRLLKLVKAFSVASQEDSDEKMIITRIKIICLL